MDRWQSDGKHSIGRIEQDRGAVLVLIIIVIIFGHDVCFRCCILSMSASFLLFLHFTTTGWGRDNRT